MKTQMPENKKSSTVACSLPAADHRKRVEWIDELNALALRDYRRDGSRIELTYDRSAAARVRELVYREQQCCRFLDLALRDEERGLVVVIEAPEEAIDAIDASLASDIVGR
jgi:hypothetical protein